MASLRIRTDGERNMQDVKRRIIIVEDDHDYAELLARMLQARGHETRIALDALDATLMAADFRPELAIIDLGLPGMDGLELATWLCVHPKLRQTVFIAITGNPTVTLARPKGDAGFHAYLTKPIDIDALLELSEQLRPTLEGSALAPTGAAAAHR
ncbi:MAG TPA: response regulator [Polyangiaceae bacterium]|nr:response regulator [Polyangiaceae bacterium]